jgi:hypothetical protein
MEPLKWPAKCSANCLGKMRVDRAMATRDTLNATVRLLLGGPVAAIGPNRRARHFNLSRRWAMRLSLPTALAPVTVIYDAGQ